VVLEALINPIQAERKPWETFFAGFLYSTIAIIASLFLFKEYSSMVMIALTTMVSVPLIYGAIKLEEKKDLRIEKEAILFKEHGKALAFFIFLFMGYVLSFSLWYVLLPASTAKTLFDAQISTITAINSPATGNMFNISSTVGKIFLNNIKVLIFCLIFAFLYGFGSIFILTWNASVLAAVIGSLIKESAGSYLFAPIILLKYSLHGIPEIAAYFLAGLGGGIISIAVIRHDLGTKQFKHVLIDSLDLILVSVVILLGAALIEVFISPLIY
jgi:uncharacterized membrane protein SpoIIM required for sporulation